MAKAAAAVGRKQVQSLIKKVLCVTLSLEGAIFGSGVYYEEFLIISATSMILPHRYCGAY